MNNPILITFLMVAAFLLGINQSYVSISHASSILKEKDVLETLTPTKKINLEIEKIVNSIGKAVQQTIDPKQLDVMKLMSHPVANYYLGYLFDFQELLLKVNDIVDVDAEISNVYSKRSAARGGGY